MTIYRKKNLLSPFHIFTTVTPSGPEAVPDPGSDDGIKVNFYVDFLPLVQFGSQRSHVVSGRATAH